MAFAQIEDSITRILKRLVAVERASNVAPVSADWGGKAGPKFHYTAYGNEWARGADNGKSIDAKSDPYRIVIKETGIYEVVAQQRGNGSNSGRAYIGISLDGSRSALENRVEGVWTHDHSSTNFTFSTSRYMGLLLAGERVMAGPEGGMGDALTFSSNGSDGILTVRRIS